MFEACNAQVLPVPSLWHAVAPHQLLRDGARLPRHPFLARRSGSSLRDLCRAGPADDAFKHPRLQSCFAALGELRIES